mgnify:FL=1
MYCSIFCKRAKKFMVPLLGYIEERWGYLGNQKRKNNNNKIKRSVKFKIKEIIRSSKNQLSSCYMTLGNFNLPPAISGTHLGEWCDFVVNTVAMTFQIPGKKKTWPILLSLENGIVL